MAELPLTVQLVSVVVPLSHWTRRRRVAGVAGDGAVGQRGRAAVVQAAAMPPSRTRRRVAADGAVGQRGRAAVDQAAADRRRMLPLTVQLVSVAVPELNSAAAAERRSCR